MTTYTYTHPSARLLTGSFKEAICDDEFFYAPPSTIALSEGVYLDMNECPHLLVAGTTGSGKTVTLHNILCSLLIKNSPNTAQILIIDPKRICFKPFYKDSPMLYMPVITDIDKAIKALEAVQLEMDRRYEDMERREVYDWDGKKLYVLVDEFAQLVYKGKKPVQDLIANIAFLGRQAGIHLIIAVQHPSHDIISRNIVANITTRICLLVDKWSESQLILGESGAEKLHGRGDAILRHRGQLTHFQSAYISIDTLKAFCHSWKLEEDKPEISINFQTTADKFMKVLGMN